MQFADKNMIWLLAALGPLLTLFLVWSWRRRTRLIQQFIPARLLPELTEGVSPTLLKVRMVLVAGAVVFILLALARPQWGEAVEEVRQRGLDVIIAVDTSRSMLAHDVLPNRLERAKLAILDLMALCRSDRLALVAFAGSAFLQCPLTVDDDAFQQTLRALEVGIIPQGGTALAEAIDAALSAFKKGSENHKALVIFTDGEDHEAGVLEAAKKAAQAGLRIFTVGVGSAEGELLKLKDESGREDYVKDDQGNVVKSRLNSKLLSQLAAAADGFYLPLSSGKAMESLYERGLALMPKGELSRRLTTQRREQFMWPLGLAVALLLAELLLGAKPRTPQPPGARKDSKPLAALGVLLLYLCLGPPLEMVSASSASAKRNYEAGLYQEARKEYERLIEKNPKDARYRFNAGAAAYRAQQYQDALDHFSAALDPKDLTLQQSALYNLGNARFRLGESEEDPAQKSAFWEQAIKDYESALKLNPNDPDAKHNAEWVRQRIEELRKNQPQSQKPSPNSDKKDQDEKEKDEPQENQDQKQKQESPQKDGASPEQEKPESSETPKGQEPKPGEDGKKDDAANKADQPDPAQSQNKPAEQKPAKDTKGQGAEGKPADGASAEEAAAAANAAGRMTKEQADKLLDALKGSEKAMIFQPAESKRSRTRIFRDW